MTANIGATPAMIVDPATWPAIVSEYLAGQHGTTAGDALPYPEATDPVYQGAAAIQALAQTLDALVFPNDYRAINATAAAAISTGVWTKVGGWGTTAEAGSVGTGITSTANGLSFAKAGLYLVSAMVEWAGGTAGGRRIMGFGVASGVAASAFYRNIVITPDTATVDQSYTELIYVDSASLGLWGLWVNQNTAPSLSIGNRRWAARRIG